VPDQINSGYCVYPWSTNPPCNTNAPSFNAARSYHSGGVNALMGDGSVRFVKSTVAVYVWQSLSTMSGYETISADSY
jgi:prepilin-type processing-associated H-X9-DG protein